MIHIDESKRKVIIPLTLLAIVAAAYSILHTMRSRVLPQDRTFATLQDEVGKIAADESAKLVGHPGRIILVRLDTKDLPVHRDMAVDSFLKAIGKQGVLTIVDTELVDPGPIIRTSDFSWPAEMLGKVLAQHPDADAIVSFVGPPKLTDEEIEKLPAKRPKIVAISGLSYPVQLGPLFEKQVVHLAITPRGGQPKQVSSHPQSPREWFEHYFDVVKPPVARGAAK